MPPEDTGLPVDPQEPASSDQDDLPARVERSQSDEASSSAETHLPAS